MLFPFCNCSNSRLHFVTVRTIIAAVSGVRDLFNEYNTVLYSLSLLLRFLLSFRQRVIREQHGRGIDARSALHLLGGKMRSLAMRLNSTPLLTYNHPTPTCNRTTICQIEVIMNKKCM